MKSNYLKPKSKKELLRFLKNPQAKIIAGGTDLLVDLNEFITPVCFIDIWGMKELNFIKNKKDAIHIGAAATHQEIASCSIIKKHLPALTQACASIGSPQIRNKATIGGNIVTASPAGDSLPPLYVYGAKLKLCSSQGVRFLKIADFFLGPKKSNLKKGEFLEEIIIPRKGGISFFKKIGQRKAMACAKVSVAGSFTIKKGLFQNVSLALGAVAPTVIYAKKGASFLEGKPPRTEFIFKASQFASLEASPIDDIRSTKEYRKELVKALLFQELTRLS